MKRKIIVLALVLTCAFWLAGCGCSSSDTETVSEFGTPSVNVNGKVSSSSGDEAEDAQDESADVEASEASSAVTANDSLALASDDGVTTMSYEDFENIMTDSLSLDMTLDAVRNLMGCQGTAISGNGFAANTIAFYTADKSGAIMCIFDGSSSTSKLTSCSLSTL